MTQFSVPIISALIGVVVLFFGRKLFWLCVAAVGFAAGFEVAPHFVHEPTPLLMLTLGLVFGFIGALLALFMQKVAIAVAGFLAGGKLATAIAAAFLVGGILGALLLLTLFDWALIIVSSIVGAYLIEHTIALPPSGATILFIGLAAIGIVVQASMKQRSQVV